MAYSNNGPQQGNPRSRQHPRQGSFGEAPTERSHLAAEKSVELQPAPAAGAGFLCERSYCSHSTPAVADPFSRTGEDEKKKKPDLD